MTGIQRPDIDSWVSEGKSDFLQRVLDQHNVKDEMQFFPDEVLEKWRKHSRLTRSQIPKSVILGSPSSSDSDTLFKHSREIREHADKAWLWVETDHSAGDVRVRQIKRREGTGSLSFGDDLHTALCYAFRALTTPMKVTQSRNKREGRYGFKINGRHTRKRG